MPGGIETVVRSGKRSFYARFEISYRCYYGISHGQVLAYGHVEKIQHGIDIRFVNGGSLAHHVVHNLVDIHLTGCLDLRRTLGISKTTVKTYQEKLDYLITDKFSYADLIKLEAPVLEAKFHQIGIKTGEILN